MDVLQNMMLFSELVKCGGNVYTWCYDAQGKLLRSNCPDEAFLASTFELFGCKQRMLEHGDRNDVPVTLGTALGLLWGAAFEKEEGKLKRVWVIGPVFYQDVTMRGIEEGLKYYSKLESSVAWTIQLYKALEKVPTHNKGSTDEINVCGLPAKFFAWQGKKPQESWRISRLFNVVQAENGAARRARGFIQCFPGKSRARPRP